ncbi:MAG: CpsD/CapB family tyrosine-protein kinase [Candidatus Sedimenticola sp. PURPLELP]
MERLQKALDRAREERKQHVSESTEADSTNAEHPGIDNEAESAAHGDAHDQDGIVYSMTRTIQVSDQVLAENRIIAGIPSHPQADVFRVLRTKTLQKMRKLGLNSLAITSPTKGGGKSMVASNLAIAMALEINQTVLLVDMDLRRPSIEDLFGFKAETGLSNYLLDNAQIPELLINPGIERLVLLPAGRALQHSSELLSSPRMKTLVEDIVGRYQSRIIIFDLPPLLHMDDALQFMPQVQASLLLVEDNVNTPAEIQQCQRLLESTNYLGTIYNKARNKVEQQPY